MKNLKNTIIIILLFFVFSPVIFAAPNYIFQSTILPQLDNNYDLGSSSPAYNWRNIYTKALTFSTTTSGCLQGTNGVTYFTGTNCGSGSGGSGGGTGFWTRLNNSGLYPATSTDQVEIGSTATSSLASLDIEAQAGIPSFFIGSSTPYVYVLPNGHVLIGTTTDAVGQFQVSSPSGNSILLNQNLNTAQTSEIRLQGDTPTNRTQFRLINSGSADTSFGNLSNSTWFTTNTGVTNGLNFVTQASAPITFSTGGTAFTNEKFRIDSGGNVGVGTTSPWKLLSVGTSNVGSFAISTSTSGCAQFSAFGELYASGTNCGINLNSLSHDSTLSGSSYNGSATVSNWGLNLSNANTWSALQTFANSSTTLGSFGYASSTNLFAGNFTLSTTSAGCASFTSGGALFSTGVSCGTGSGGGGSDPFSHFNGVNSATTTSLAIGTTTASNYQLITASSTAPQISLSAGADQPQWTLRNAGGNLYISTTTVAGTATTSSSALTVQNNGNVGIGVTNPTHPLVVKTGPSDTALFTNDGTFAGTTGVVSIYKGNANSGDLLLSVGTENQNNQFQVKDQQALSLITYGADLGNLHVGNSGAKYQVSTANSTSQYIDYDSATNDNIVINANLGNSAILMSIKGTTIATASTTGFLVSSNLGIGTTTPDASLDANGSVKFEGSSYAVTSSLGGGALLAGACASVTTTITSLGGYASTTAVITTPKSDPGDGFDWNSVVMSPTSIKTRVCAETAGTPNASVYNLKIIK